MTYVIFLAGLLTLVFATAQASQTSWYSLSAMVAAGGALMLLSISI